MSLHSCQDCTTALNSTKPHTDLLNKDRREKRREKMGRLGKKEKVVRLISEKREQNKGRPQEKKKEINNKVGKWSEATRVCS